MSTLTKEIINKFSKIIIDRSKTQEKPTAKIFGTVRTSGNDKFVQLDGSEYITPLVEAEDAHKDDRVLVEVSNHKAIISANFTAPASSREATSYLRKTSKEYEGYTVTIGDFEDDNRPAGCYLELKNNGMAVHSDNTEEIMFVNENGSISGKNGEELLNQGNAFMFKYIQVKNISMPNGTKRLGPYSPKLPSGYMIAGISAMELVGNISNLPLSGAFISGQLINNGKTLYFDVQSTITTQVVNINATLFLIRSDSYQTDVSEVF